MAREKFRAQPKIGPDGRPLIPLHVPVAEKSFLQRFGPIIAVAMLMAVGLFAYYRIFGDTAAKYDRTISSCVISQTQKAGASGEEATANCLRSHTIETP